MILLSCINSSSFLKDYAGFKSVLEPEKYILGLYYDKDLVRILCKFRCLSHRLNIQQRRYNGDIDEKLLKCNKCDLDVVQDEYHFLLVCPFYSVQRQLYIPMYYHCYPSRSKFKQLLLTQNVQLLK